MTGWQGEIDKSGFWFAAKSTLGYEPEGSDNLTVIYVDRENGSVRFVGVDGCWELATYRTFNDGPFLRIEHPTLPAQIPTVPNS